jgi:hypothetical protein
VATEQKKNAGSRRGPTRDKLIKDILDSYHVTDGCPPPAKHWGGYDLAKTEWLKRFAEEITIDDKRLEAWGMLKGKCDTSFLIELLYLMTVRAKVWKEKSQEVHRALAIEIDKVISRYDKLGESISDLRRNPRFSHPIPFARLDLAQELHRLQDSKKHLELLRDFHKKAGSYKRNPRNWYFFVLARNILKATGRRHVRELASLVDSARAAHNEKGEVSDVDKLAKRIQHYKEFLESLNSIRNRERENIRFLRAF